MNAQPSELLRRAQTLSETVTSPIRGSRKTYVRGSRDDLRIEGIGQFGGSRWLDGRIYAVAAIGRTIDDAEADALARWIAAKAGVAV